MQLPPDSKEFHNDPVLAVDQLLAFHGPETAACPHLGSCMTAQQPAVMDYASNHCSSGCTWFTLE